MDFYSIMHVPYMCVNTCIIEHFSALRDPAICDYVVEPGGKYTKLSKPETGKRKTLQWTMER